MDEHARGIHPIDEGDLLAFFDGAAPPEAAAHIAGCPDCLAEARALGTMSALLGAALARESCPQPGELLEWSMGFSDSATAEHIRQHLAGCERCRAELAEQSAVDEGRATERAVPQLWAPLDAAALSTPPGARRLLGRQMTPARSVAMRGQERRQLVFEAGAYTVVVSLLVPAVAEQGWRLEGQISTGDDGEPALEGATVTLLAGATPTAGDGVDDLGYFTLEAVPAGSYSLEITAGETTIAIDDVQLQ